MNLFFSVWCNFFSSAENASLAQPLIIFFYPPILFHHLGKVLGTPEDHSIHGMLLYNGIVLHFHILICSVQNSVVGHCPPPILQQPDFQQGHYISFDLLICLCLVRCNILVNFQDHPNAWMNGHRDYGSAEYPIPFWWHLHQDGVNAWLYASSFGLYHKNKATYVLDHKHQAPIDLIYGKSDHGLWKHKPQFLWR